MRRAFTMSASATAGVAGIAVSLAAAALGMTKSGGEGNSLAWRAPKLSVPVVVDVSNANRRLILDDATDYVLRLVEPLERELWIEGGRNVVVVGGQISINTIGTSNAYRDNTAVKVRFGNPAGTVHLEGLLIDGQFVNDGIVIATARSVQVSNVRIERSHNGIKGQHGDCLQIQQGVGDLRVDGFTCTTELQGIFLDDTYGRTGSIELRNVDIVGDPGKHLLFQTTPSTGPIRLKNVWLTTARPWASFGWWVYPPVGGVGIGVDGATSRRAVVTKRRGGRSGREPALSFVNTAITGQVFQGHPYERDFVPAGVAGMDYVSPNR